MRSLPCAGLLLVLGCPAIASAGKKPPQQICGIVVQPRCAPKPGDPDTAAVLTLLIQPGISANVEAKDATLADAFRARALSLFYQQACATGRLADKQNDKHPARFLVETPDDIVATGPGPSDWSPADIHTVCETGLTMPTVKGTAPRPSSTRTAMDFHVTGAALIEAIVGVDGTVENVRLLKSVDAKHPLGLDAEAMKCARAWRFNPGTKDGVPVRVAVTIELTFALK
jgi:TonB family protein